MPNTPERPCRVRVQREGPLLIEGPVEVVDEDGEVTVSNRFTVAICTCRRSRTYPWCDTSHRRRVKRPRPAASCDHPSGAAPQAVRGGGKTASEPGAGRDGVTSTEEEQA